MPITNEELSNLLFLSNIFTQILLQILKEVPMTGATYKDLKLTCRRWDVLLATTATGTLELRIVETHFPLLNAIRGRGLLGRKDLFIKLYRTNNRMLSNTQYILGEIATDLRPKKLPAGTPAWPQFNPIIPPTEPDEGREVIELGNTLLMEMAHNSQLLHNSGVSVNKRWTRAEMVKQFKLDANGLQAIRITIMTLWRQVRGDVMAEYDCQSVDEAMSEREHYKVFEAAVLQVLCYNPFENWSFEQYEGLFIDVYMVFMGAKFDTTGNYWWNMIVDGRIPGVLMSAEPWADFSNEIESAIKDEATAVITAATDEKDGTTLDWFDANQAGITSGDLLGDILSNLKISKLKKSGGAVRSAERQFEAWSLMWSLV